MTLKEIADAVGGSVHDAEPETVVTGCAQHDSRPPEPGDIANLASLVRPRVGVVTNVGVEAGHVSDAPAALELIRRRRAAGDVILVKGSNSLALQALVRQLEMDGVDQGRTDTERSAT